MLNALVVDDDPDFQDALAASVRLEGFGVATAASLREARAALLRQPPDVVFVDLNLPDGSGLELLQADSLPQTVLITGQASVETAVQALRLGAADYLTKPVDFARVQAVLAHVERTAELRQEVGSLRGELRRLGRFGLLIGRSEKMQEVYDLVARVARTDASVLITGETGTGKELVAQTLHQLSRRRGEAFVPVNCGAIAPTLIESELFGHERGSFTGADRVHRGCFERAHRGTLLLDEVTEMTPELQVKLLRVLETSSFTRLGGAEPLRVDVRLVAATNRLPEEAVAAGRLRQDLLYRLDVFPISLPPLRERQDDVGLLAAHFLEELNRQAGTRKQWTSGALDRLHGHRWPGNIRELRNVVQRAFILAEDDLEARHVPLGGRAPASAPSLPVLPVGSSIAEVERLLILATLQHCGGDKQRAVGLLRISLKTLYNRLQAYKHGS